MTDWCFEKNNNSQYVLVVTKKLGIKITHHPFRIYLDKRKKNDIKKRDSGMCLDRMASLNEVIITVNI